MDSGVSESGVGRRLAAEHWDPVEPCVYRIVGAPVTWRGDLLAAVWSAGAEALASHRSAAALWRLDGFEDGPLELSVPNRLVRRTVRARVHRVQELVSCDRSTIDAIPVTTIDRTLVDLAGVLRIGGLAHALDSAFVQGLTRPDRVLARLLGLGRRGRKGAGVLARLLDERLGGAAPPESRFERRLERMLLAAGLPAPTRQHEVYDDEGFIGRLDLAYPRARFAIEADSYRWHAGHEPWRRDLRRRTRLAAAGWRVAHCTWRELVHEPANVARRVRTALDV